MKMVSIGIKVVILFCGILSVEKVSSLYCLAYYGKVCYDFLPFTFSNLEAKENCRIEGGELAIVYNLDILKILQGIVSLMRLSYWIASPNLVDEGQFLFSDGTPFNSSLVTYDDDYFKYSEHDCLYIDSEVLKNSNCEAKRFYVCQFEGKKCNLTNEDLATYSYDQCMLKVLQPTEQLPVVCKEGYVIEPGATVSCVAKGYLESKPCVPGCYPPKISKNAKITNFKEIYYTEDILLVICEKGFFGIDEDLKTHMYAICLPGGHWSTTDFNCINIQPFQLVHNTLVEEPIMLRERSTVLLDCPEEGYENIWIKDQKIISKAHTKYEFRDDGKLIIKDFSVNDTGLYACINAKNKYLVHNLKIMKRCSYFENNYFETHTMEGSKLFLECNGTSDASDIKWFKNNERFWGNEKIKIFRNGMIIFENIQWSDTAVYHCMVWDLGNKCTQNTTINVHVQPKDKCGLLAGETPLIDLRKMPWLAALCWPANFMPFCYGTLISDHWIITTASCLFDSYERKNSGFIVKFGKDTEDFEDLYNSTATSKITATDVFIHPNYSRRLNLNDIGLVRLDSPFTDENYPICLPLDPALTDENSCQHPTINHGYISDFGPLDGRRQNKTVVEEVKITSHSVCQITFSLPPNMICVSSEATTLAGDKGTPLQIKWRDRWYLWGVFSFEDRASSSNKYDYYYKVTKFLPWIKSVINDTQL